MPRTYTAAHILILVLLLALVPYANAGVILFDFNAQATDVSQTRQTNQSPGFEQSNLIGGLGEGGTLAGTISISDLSIEDSSPGGDVDEFSLRDNLSDLFRSPNNPQNDFGFSWQFGTETADLNSAGDAASVQTVGLIVTDSPQGDSISIRISRSGGTRGSSRTLALEFTDPTGTVFPGSGNLTDQYVDAVSLLTSVDFSLFSEANVSVFSTIGRTRPTEETILANVTSFNVRSVPEPGSLVFFALGFLFFMSRSRTFGFSQLTGRTQVTQTT